MIVEHQQPSDQLDTTGSDEENWQPPINALTYGTDETSILGFIANADDVNTAEHPHGTVVATLTDSSIVDFWQSDSGEELAYSFSVVQWPRSRVLAINIIESLSFTDKANTHLTLALSDSISFNDGNIESPKVANISLFDSIDMNDNINKNVPSTLSETLELADNINKNIPVVITETLSLNDNINHSTAVALTESLVLVDVVDTTTSRLVSLTESLDLSDNINRVLTISLTESLSLSDAAVMVTGFLTASLTESLSLSDGTVEKLGGISLETRTGSSSLVTGATYRITPSPTNGTDTFTITDGDSNDTDGANKD